MLRLLSALSLLSLFSLSLSTSQQPQPQPQQQQPEPDSLSLRDSVSFDFGWRFRLGRSHTPLPPPAPTPPVGCSGPFSFAPEPGRQCGGLFYDAKGSESAEACERNCCDSNDCGVWQFANNTEQGGGCWRGLCTSPLTPNQNWNGGSRSPPVPGGHSPAPSPVGPDPPESQPSYDDATGNWTLVNAPHDSLIAQAPSDTACPGGCSGHSYIPRYGAWYRKHFTLPEQWHNDTDAAVYLYFGGTFRETTIWLNGVNVSHHVSGYTSFTLRLDSLPSVGFGASSPNVLALYTDPNKGKSGWWYEGSGLYRHVQLVKTSKLAVIPDGLFGFSNFTGVTGANGHLTADSAAVTAAAELGNLRGAAAENVSVLFEVLEQGTGRVVGQKVSDTVSVPPNDATVETATKVTAVVDGLKDVELWQIQNPNLYTLRATVLVNGQPVDAVNTTTGFRSLRYDANDGMFLNGQYTKVRGFCDHNDFANFGMGVPDRIKLFRAQASRSVGGNGRRTSHNAPDPIMLDIYDRLGIAVMDENRQIYNESQYIGDMRDLVHRDRNHPSVTIWSFCNEAGCESAANEAGGPAFQKVTYEMDGSRPTLANMFTFGDLLSKTIDVQGFSHQSRDKVDAAHAAYPEKPIYMSECCSCNTMRGEDYSIAGSLQESFNGACQEGQTNASNGITYAMGTMVWTLFDYYGEPSNGGWPFVSSTFGAFDLAGFAKAASFWFRSQWLYAIPDSRSDKTFLTDTLQSTHQDHMVHIVERWQPAPNPPPLQPSTNQSWLARCDGSVRQQLSFNASGSGAIEAASEGRCLSVSGCNGTSSNCYPLNFDACDATDTRQKWTVRGAGFESVALTGYCLDAYGDEGPGDRVGVWHCGQTEQQTWSAVADTIREGVSDPTAPNGRCLSTTPSDTLPPQRSVHVYSSAPFVKLFANGKSLGIQAIKTATAGGPSFATYNSLAFSPGNLTALALAGNSTTAQVLSTHTVVTAGAAAKLQLSIDVPSVLTGTGSALLLDGQDAGLVRCTIVDANGNQAHDSSANVTFSIVSGPGRIVGAHSGDPQSHEHNQKPFHTAYHGLARAAIAVSSAAARDAKERALLAQIDLDSSLVDSAAAEPIVVQATAPGLGSATVSIPTSLDIAKDSVLAVATEFGTKPVLGFA